jgi:hypothetical protein
VRAVLLSRWAELTTNSLQGQKRASELPRTAHTDGFLGKRRVLPFEYFTVVRVDRRGKKVNLCAAREINGRQRTIKRGLTLGLPHPPAAFRGREARTPKVSL